MDYQTPRELVMLTLAPQISMVTSNIIEALVSIKRLSAFFSADELQPDVRQVAELECGDVVVSITDGEFCWNKNAVSSTLENINVTVRKGELLGVLGRVGAGKVRYRPATVRRYIIHDYIDELVVSDRRRDDSRRRRGQSLRLDIIRASEPLVRPSSAK